MSNTSARDGNSAIGSVIDLLALAAAPTFAVMAAVEAVSPAMHCSTMMSMSPLNGMAVMYVLMGAFHSGPWLKQISSRRNDALKNVLLQPGARS